VIVAPTGDGFTSKFPAKPKLTKSTTSTKEGPTPTSVWEYLANANLDYNIALWQYPAGSLASTAASAAYDSAINAMDTSNGLTLSAQSDINLDGHMGRAFTLTGSYTLKGELVLVGNNLYLVYASYGPSIDTADVLAFLADFKLTA